MLYHRERPRGPRWYQPAVVQASQWHVCHQGMQWPSAFSWWIGRWSFARMADNSCDKLAGEPAELPMVKWWQQGFIGWPRAAGGNPLLVRGIRLFADGATFGGLLVYRCGMKVAVGSLPVAAGYQWEKRSGDAIGLPADAGAKEWSRLSVKSPEDYRTNSGQRPDTTRISKWYNCYSGKIKEKPQQLLGFSS